MDHFSQVFYPVCYESAFLQVELADCALQRGEHHVFVLQMSFNSLSEYDHIFQMFEGSAHIGLTKQNIQCTLKISTWMSKVNRHMLEPIRDPLERKHGLFAIFVCIFHL